MSLITGKNISLSFGADPVLHNLDFRIDKDESLCLVGKNGAGKSSFLKLLTKKLLPDDGEISFQKGLKISVMDQQVPEIADASCYDIIASGISQEVKVLSEYHSVLRRIDLEPENMGLLQQLEKLQQQIDDQHLWEVDRQIDKAATLLNIDLDMDFNALSGGRKRRAWLARALVNEPDILLLDEPTNHIDLETVLWLETFLLSWQGTLVFISHDRSFINKLATRIIEIDRGKASSWPGNYQHYLEKKQEALEVEEKQNQLFDKKLAQEEVWIRQGIKARRTRNEGRVRALIALRDQRRNRREIGKAASFDISKADKSSKVVIEAEKLNLSFGNGAQILKDFSCLILRGDRIGIIGPNGAGKTSLLKVLLSELKPDSGEIKRAANLEIAYFDQMRNVLKEEKSIVENVVEGSDYLNIGDRSVHVISYLKDFLFSPQRLNTPVAALSGGERNRVLLAKLFSRPSNFLVLDEPTNDLDMETLELLEEKLSEYPGTVILISHDRTFLNNIVTSTLVFEEGRVNEYVGGYDDWLAQRSSMKAIKERSGIQDLKESSQHSEKPQLQSSEEGSKTNQKKLSYKEQRELENLPKTIEHLEQEISALHVLLSQPEQYQQGKHELVNEAGFRLPLAEQELEAAFKRWAELEDS